ncbi:MAG: hypothetical protein V7K47_08115 [Nostoc sp.]
MNRVSTLGRSQNDRILILFKISVLIEAIASATVSSMIIKAPRRILIVLVHNTSPFVHNTSPFVHNTSLFVHNTSSFVHNTSSFVHNTSSFVHNTGLLVQNTSPFIITEYEQRANEDKEDI